MFQIAKKIYLFISNYIIENNFFPYRGLKKYDLIIYDDIFPHPVSGFRLEEFTILLSEFKNSKCMLVPEAYNVIKTPIEEHQNHITKFNSQNPSLKSKIRLKNRFYNINTKLFYCVFISNIYKNLNWLEKFKIPFVFTLYPGGRFIINDEASDLMLTKVLSSPMLRKVIVTQNFTKEYLLKNNFCSEDKIEFIFGGVVPQISLHKNLTNRKNYLKNKTTLDICFCAAKYSPKGEDKGYDIFIEAAHSLVSKFDFIQFHIIGGFNENDIDVTTIKNKVTFYGFQKYEELEAIFKEMDIMISPNKPFLLNKGSFDGFPLGTVVEAALNGVVVLISDDLKQNTTFVDNEELIIIESNINSIVEKVIKLIENPIKLEEISNKGNLKFSKIYSNQVQMNPRIDLLKKLAV